MIPLIALMIGAYIITRMMIFLLNKNPDQIKPGNIINKILATVTIVITVVCVVLIFSSSISSFDIEETKPDEISFKSEEVEGSKKPRMKDSEELEQKQAYIDKVKILNLRVAEAQFGGLGVFGEIKNTGDKTLTKVEITIYFLDKNNKPIFEETYHPVYVSEYSIGDNKPLKPNYSKKFGYKPDNITSDWAEKVLAKITNIEFEK